MYLHTLCILNIKSCDWALFRNATYSIVQTLNQSDKGVLVTKEMAIAITFNIKSEIQKNNVVA